MKGGFFSSDVVLLVIIIKADIKEFNIVLKLCVFLLFKSSNKSFLLAWLKNKQTRPNKPKQNHKTNHNKTTKQTSCCLPPRPNNNKKNNAKNNDLKKRII